MYLRDEKNLSDEKLVTKNRETINNFNEMEIFRVWRTYFGSVKIGV